MTAAARECTGAILATTLGAAGRGADHATWASVAITSHHHMPHLPLRSSNTVTIRAIGGKCYIITFFMLEQGDFPDASRLAPSLPTSISVKPPIGLSGKRP
jgi:hypothetical protein